IWTAHRQHDNSLFCLDGGERPARRSAHTRATLARQESMLSDCPALTARCASPAHGVVFSPKGRWSFSVAVGDVGHFSLALSARFTSRPGGAAEVSGSVALAACVANDAMWTLRHSATRWRSRYHRGKSWGHLSR